MKKIVAGLSLLALAGCCTCPKSAVNTLTEAEKADGWTLLWDGKTSDGWVGAKSHCKTFPKASWVMADGVLTVYPVKGTEAKPWTVAPTKEVWDAQGGDILTAKKYRSFIFKVDFRLTEAANSGIKYFVDEDINNGTSIEFQLLDKGHADWNKGRDGNRRIGALYDMIPATVPGDSVVKPVGEWNTAMLVVNGNHVEHWINGTKVLEYERGGKQFMEAFAKSKYTDAKNFNKNGKWGLTPVGRILLQDHSDSTVSFRNIKIKEL